MTPEPVLAKHRHPLCKLDTLFANIPKDCTIRVNRSLTLVYRSPCGVAQCRALNPANAAQIEYGTNKQLQ
jgi:hypothetical protein